MTEYQRNLVVDAYFNKLMEDGIDEGKVKDFGQVGGELYIVLENGNKITERIKNFYN